MLTGVIRSKPNLRIKPPTVSNHYHYPSLPPSLHSDRHLDHQNLHTPPNRTPTTTRPIAPPFITKPCSNPHQKPNCFGSFYRPFGARSSSCRHRRLPRAKADQIVPLPRPLVVVSGFVEETSEASDFSFFPPRLSFRAVFDPQRSRVATTRRPVALRPPCTSTGRPDHRAGARDSADRSSAQPSSSRSVQPRQPIIIRSQTAADRDADPQ
ncbi:hypothetical protein V6N11_026171 [Hibiscus sabdariffa]|uniref:Uncharacterized protein n=1 Tax=Hibiscus sabdariffa TaxID=183260 RepID=A0ABR2SVH7_9ROSI